MKKAQKAKKKKRIVNDYAKQWILLAPAVIVFLVFFLYPVGTSLYYSFTDWNGISWSMNFVWFENYKTMFSQNELLRTIPVTLEYAFLNTIMMSFLGLLLALALNRGSWFTGIMRVCFFLPMLVSSLVVGFVFKDIFAPVINEETMGSLNLLLTKLGLKFLRANWLGRDSALLMCVGTGVWNSVGQTALIFLANIMSIPKDLYEAAEIDGAGYWKQQYHVTWRMLAPSFSVNLTLLMINSMKQYDTIAILTQGGPGTATRVINLAIMDLSVSSQKVGLGCAMAVVVSVFITVTVTIINRLMRKREVYV